MRDYGFKFCVMCQRCAQGRGCEVVNDKVEPPLCFGVKRYLDSKEEPGVCFAKEDDTEAERPGAL